LLSTKKITLKIFEQKDREGKDREKGRHRQMKERKGLKMKTVNQGDDKINKH
jgi:hypothetical protein